MHARLTCADLGTDSLFGNDAAEEEDPEILASYFVDLPEFDEFFDASTRLRFARSRKGMGKSALLAKTEYDLRASGNFVVAVAGADLTDRGAFESEDSSILVNQWVQTIATRINHALANEIGFAWSDDQLAVIDSAELSGFKSRSFFRGLYDRMTIQGLTLDATRVPASNAGQALARLQAGKTTQPIWLLVDDVDSKFENTPYYHRKVSTFFSACRKLIKDVQGLNIRASVRSDVWAVLSHHEDLDKAEQYMTDIRWTQPQMAAILAKRVQAYVRRAYPGSDEAHLDPSIDSERLVRLAFEARVRWGASMVPPIQVVNILCAKRPRWMAQLCRMAGKRARAGNHDKISSAAITSVMKQFGKSRLADLHKEHGHQFSDIDAVVEIFARGKRAYPTRELTALLFNRYLGQMPPEKRPTLDGRQLLDPLELAHFLFRIGFLQGQRPGDGGGSFVDYDDRPQLLKHRANLDDGLTWAIYPSYRNVLGIGATAHDDP